MAKNKKAQNNWQDIQFVSISLTAQDKLAFERWVEAQANALLSMWSDMCANGYKFSQRWDDDNDCFIISATCLASADVNMNKCLTARSSDYWEACWLLLYKHHEMVDDCVWPDVGSGTRWG